MRKVKLQMQVSLDGFVAGPNGEMDWMTWNWDDELKEYVTALTESVDSILLGRVLAQGFIPHWTAASKNPESDSFTHKMVDTPKIVFSKTLTSSEWENTVLAEGTIEDAVTHLKQQEGNDIIVYGGSNFVSNLIKHNLIDEYHLFVNPVAIGSGMPIFLGLEEKLPLKLIQSKGFSCGITVLCYKPDKN
jgi:dihydrofolate reductase